MPQTISVVKGTVACNWTSNAITAPQQTIFTQSTGISTRVIINSLELQSTQYGVAALQFFLVNGTTGFASLMGILQTGGRPSSNFALLQQPGITGNSYGTTQASSAGFVFQENYTVRTSLSTSIPESVQYWPPASGAQAGYLPTNFWIPNGDSLTVRGYWGGGTGNCYYNFTLITES